MQVELERIAKAQRGLITRTQALDFVSEDQLKWSLEQRRLIPLFRTVYRSAGSPFGKLDEILAGVLASGADAVASHQSALVVHGLWKDHSHAPEVTVSPTHNNKHLKLNVHRRALEDNQRVVVDGIPVTNLPLTLVDAATFLHPTDLARLMRHTVARGLTTFAAIDLVVEKLPKRGRKGTRILRQLMAEHVGIATNFDSPLEFRFLALVHRLGLPHPETQYEVCVEGRRYRIDVAWPELNIAIELDGSASHSGSKRFFDDDRRRQNALQNDIWKVYRFTARMSDREITATLRRIFVNSASLGGE